MTYGCTITLSIASLARLKIGSYFWHVPYLMQFPPQMLVHLRRKLSFTPIGDQNKPVELSLLSGFNLLGNKNGAFFIYHMLVPFLMFKQLFCSTTFTRSPYPCTGAQANHSS